MKKQGADEIVFLDIKASVDNQPHGISHDKPSSKNFMHPFYCRWWIKKTSRCRKGFFDAGADKVTLNTASG